MVLIALFIRSSQPIPSTTFNTVNVISYATRYTLAAMGDDAIDLATQLLKKNPAERLGHGGIGDIRAHKFFEGYNWDAVKDESMDPPFVPDSDVNAADQDTIGKFKNETEVQAIDLSDKDHAKYKKFSGANKSAFEQDVVGLLQWEQREGRPLTATPIEKSKTCTVS